MSSYFQINFRYSNLASKFEELETVLNVLKNFCREFSLNENFIVHSLERVCGIDENIVRFDANCYVDNEFIKVSRKFLKENLWKNDCIKFSYGCIKRNLYLNFYDEKKYLKFKTSKRINL